MGIFSKYLDEIIEREKIGLGPKPIDNGELLKKIITNILDNKSKYHSKSLNFFIYNVLPGTTAASNVKSKFLKEIILGIHKIDKISVDFAFELLSHMKGGSSIEVLIDLALDKDSNNANQIIRNIINLYKDITLIVVTHHEGILKSFNRSINIESSKLVIKNL